MLKNSKRCLLSSSYRKKVMGGKDMLCTFQDGISLIFFEYIKKSKMQVMQVSGV